jgi:hypothetical protein
MRSFLEAKGIVFSEDGQVISNAMGVIYNAISVKRIG